MSAGPRVHGEDAVGPSGDALLAAGGAQAASARVRVAQSQPTVTSAAPAAA